MSSRVHFQNGIIYQHAHRDGLSVETLKEDLVELLKIQKELEKEKAPFVMLYDATNARTADSEIRAQALHNMSCLNYTRVAVFGIRSIFLNQMAKLIIMGMGKGKKIKIFDSKEKAENWLKNGGWFFSQKIKSKI